MFRVVTLFIRICVCACMQLLCDMFNSFKMFLFCTALQRVFLLRWTIFLCPEFIMNQTCYRFRGKIGKVRFNIQSLTPTIRWKTAKLTISGQDQMGSDGEPTLWKWGSRALGPPPARLLQKHHPHSQWWHGNLIEKHIPQNNVPCRSLEECFPLGDLSLNGQRNR